MSKILMLALGAMTIIFVQSFAGGIEGRFFPVVAPVVLSDPRPDDPSITRYRWTGEVQKIRDCEFVRIEWNLGLRAANHVAVPFEFRSSPKVRGPGAFSVDMLISLEPRRVVDNSHADALHRCPFRPWLTRTPFHN